MRYMPHLPMQPPPQITLEAAVDLTKKSEHWRPNVGHPDHMDGDDQDDGSDSDTPLDMSVTATRLTPVFPGFHRFDREVSPARSDRSDMLVRLPGLYSPGSVPRDWSTDRSEADKGKKIQDKKKDPKLQLRQNLDEYSRDGCHICGMPRAEMSAYEHGEGVCNQRPISCPLCSKTFTLWSHYETHKKCHQKLKQRQYPCQSCGKVRINANALIQHILTHHLCPDIHLCQQPQHAPEDTQGGQAIPVRALWGVLQTEGTSAVSDSSSKTKLESNQHV